MTHYCWVSSLISTTIPVCVSLQYSSMFVITRSKMGGDCSHTRAPIEITGQTGAGESWGSTQPAKTVCVCTCRAIWSFNFTTSDIKRKDKNTPLVSTPIYPTDRKWTFKGFLLFSVLFATPCQHTPLFLIWSRLLRAIKCQISLQQTTDSHQLLVRLPVERRLTSVGGEA